MDNKTQKIIDDIRALCVRNYDKGYGFSVIVECYSDAELFKLICEDHNRPAWKREEAEMTFPSRAKAMQIVRAYVDIWSEQCEEVEATAW